MEWVKLNNGERVRVANHDDTPSFPPASQALNDPAGLVQIGGQLNADWLLEAYQSGIFPWYSQEDPILWWSPDPRTILIPAELRITRSLSKVIRNGGFNITFDTAFDEVIDACAFTRDETWIVPEMIDGYRQLFQQGYAHSVEVWRNDKLVGGLYGLALGKIFFGESMFAKESNASKVALANLCNQLIKWNFNVIDCQFTTDHLLSLGAKPIKREAFLILLDEALQHPIDQSSWCYLNSE